MSLRSSFRSACLQRDRSLCKACGRPAADAHHISDRYEMPNGGYAPENGVSLCEDCHLKAEEWHRSGKTRSEPGFSPEDLYRMIGSSHEKAVEASKSLGCKE
jgi:5-methylcytosine-specific restriction endonuclease McrA